MKILFCIHDFRVDNLRLQPWLTIHQLGKCMVEEGHQVRILTDIQALASVDGIRTHTVKSLRGSNSDEIIRIIKKISPDVAIISVSPLSLVTSKWNRKLKRIRLYAFLSYPFYNLSEIFRAFFHLNSYDKYAYTRHVLIPKLFWGYLLFKYFRGAFSQSIRTGNRICNNGEFPAYKIQPGIDKNIWPFLDQKEKKEFGETHFLYAGSPKRIRGFNLILKAFTKTSNRKIKLTILARGAKGKKLSSILEKVDRFGSNGQIQVIGGWISQYQFRQYIMAADAVLLPFILVPSELPVTVMESIACGTPVIVSDIDGMPEAAGDCGLVVRQADSRHLSETICKFHEDKDLRKQLQKNCKVNYEKMNSWKDITRKWLNIIETESNEK